MTTKKKKPASSLLKILIACLFIMSANNLMSQQNITFIGIKDQKVRKCFLKVLDRYKSLQKYPISLKQKRVKSATMQAQPVFTLKSIFGSVKSYRVKLAKFVRDSKKIKVNNLPDSVLTGWFAHELGHLVDYEPYSSWQMLGYGLKYLFSKKFRRKAEHAADYIAIANGFHKEIIATKRFILENEFLSPAYQDKIKKYYLSIEEVKLCTEGEMLLEPVTSGL